MQLEVQSKDQSVQSEEWEVHWVRHLVGVRPFRRGPSGKVRKSILILNSCILNYKRLCPSVCVSCHVMLPDNLSAVTALNI